MSLEQINKKIKFWLTAQQVRICGRIAVGLLVIYNGIGLYFLGQIEKPPDIEVIKAFNSNIIHSYEQMSTGAESVQKMAIIASKNGTKYYFSHCTGVNRIKEENKVYFGSVAEAEMAGYTRASGCK